MYNNKFVKYVSGDIANIGVLEDNNLAFFKVISGPHSGHTLEVDTAKHNCGAFQIDILCSCGSVYRNGINGCWQYEHQRKEVGDTSMRQLADEIPGHIRSSEFVPNES